MVKSHHHHKESATANVHLPVPQTLDSMIFDETSPSCDITLHTTLPIDYYRPKNYISGTE